jgi:hypothetical protein
MTKTSCFTHQYKRNRCLRWCNLRRELQRPTPSDGRLILIATCFHSLRLSVWSCVGGHSCFSSLRVTYLLLGKMKPICWSVRDLIFRMDGQIYQTPDGRRQILMGRSRLSIVSHPPKGWAFLLETNSEPCTRLTIASNLFKNFTLLRILFRLLLLFSRHRKWDKWHG